MNQSRVTLSVTDFAKAVGISRNSAYDAVRRGEVPHLRIGRRILIPVVALDAFLACGLKKAS